MRFAQPPVLLPLHRVSLLLLSPDIAFAGGSSYTAASSISQRSCKVAKRKVPIPKFARLDLASEKFDEWDLPEVRHWHMGSHSGEPGVAQ